MVSRTLVQVPEFYNKYVQKAASDNLVESLRKNAKAFRKLMETVPGKKRDFAYGPGKWTLRQLIQHMIDAERVFVLRALWFARGDASGQPGFDENVWAAQATAADRRWEDLEAEFSALRKSTILFFESLSDEELIKTGTANQNVMSVAGLGFVCSGHVEHHLEIIRERYLAPAKKASAKKKKA